MLTAENELAPASNSQMPKMLDGKRVEVFYDSDCPLCEKEIRVLRCLDRRNRVQFTDVADPEFDANRYRLTFDDFMDEIQGRKADGTWMTGVEVLRQVYSAVGFGLLVAPTRLPGISHLLDWCYAIFARNRLKWTGRCKEDCAVK